MNKLVVKLFKSSLSFVFILVLALNTFMNDLRAQDPIFSQTYAAPLYMNPALVGAFDGTYRLSILYRDQYRGQVDAPFRSYMFNAEGKFEVSYNKTYNPDIVGVGVIFLSDVVDNFSLSTNQIQLVGSYHKSLNKNKDQYIGMGISAGITQKSINYDNLTFEDQFNQLDAYSFNTAENLPPNSVGVSDFSIGLNYAVSPNKDSRLWAGLAYHHFGQANISLFNQLDTPIPGQVTEDILASKYTVYASYQRRLNESLSIGPRAIYANQQQRTEITIGSTLIFDLNDTQDVSFGLGLRTLDHLDGMKPTAVILSSAFQFKDFQFGLSYDANILDLSGDPAGLNAFEISISFNGNYTNAVDICPKF